LAKVLGVDAMPPAVDAEWRAGNLQEYAVSQR
jgi:hypothetical protein